MFALKNTWLPCQYCCSERVEQYGNNVTPITRLSFIKIGSLDFMSVGNLEKTPLC